MNLIINHRAGALFGGGGMYSVATVGRSTGAAA
jgi:hypothetical protein